MIPPPSSSTRTDTPFPDATLFRSVDMDTMGGDGILQRTRHGPQRCLMQNVIEARKRLGAVIDIADIAFVKYKISPFFGPDCFPDFVQDRKSTRLNSSH